MWISAALKRAAVTSIVIIFLEVIIARVKMATIFQQTIIAIMVKLCLKLSPFNLL